MGVTTTGNEPKCDLRLCQKFLLSKIETVERENAAKFNAIDEATRLNAEIVTKRFESVNEFRSAMNDLTKTFATIKEAGILFDKLDENQEKIEKDISDIQISWAQLVGKASQNQVLISYLIALAGLFLGIINIIIYLAGKI